MNETLWSVRAPADTDLHNKKTHTQYSTVPSTFLSLSLTRFLDAFLDSQ